jgi:hypothetical protein
MRGFRLEHLLKRLLDENEFLSDMEFVRLSKYHKENPYVFGTGAIIPFNMNQVKAALGMFGGNSNWRGLSGCQ